MKDLFFLTVVLLLCAHFKAHSEDTDYYVAAVVEFSPEIGSPVPLGESVVNNLRKYHDLIVEAKSKGADIIVFPETGLKSVGFFEVPHPRDAVSPCLQPLEWADLPMNHLSCLARKHKIYVAFNLYEKSGAKSYNTNVVFDRNGVVVSRYRKMHLFNEPYLQIPDEKDFSVFHTDFGVTFGVAICFDLLFREPASELVHTHNIRHLVYSSAWFSEMPFLTADQVQAAWAWSHNSVLLASGLNLPKNGNTGSGIYAGRKGMVKTIFTDKQRTQLLIGRVPKNLNVKNDAKTAPTAAYKDDIESTGTVPSFFNIRLLEDSLKEFSSQLLPSGYDEKVIKLCHEEFCCHFNTKTTTDNESPWITHQNQQPYRLFAWSGVRDFVGDAKGGVQVCAVVACRNAIDVKSCAYPVPSNQFRKVQFSKLQISGDFETANTMTLANTLNLNLQPLPADAFDLVESEREQRKTMVLTEQREDIHTFAIYNRVFTWDK